MWLVATLLACNGPETDLNRNYPEAAVSVDVLDFGEVSVGYSSTLQLDVINGGRVGMNVSDVSLADALGAYEILSAPDTVAAGEREPIEVLFHPPDYTTYDAVLTVATDDPETPTLDVVLTGRGVQVPTPDIDVDTLSLDFGEVAAGSSATKWFVISNDGDGALEISQAIQAGSGAFEVVGSLDGYTLQPDQSLNLIVNYAPTTDQGDNGSLVIASNDPDESPLTVYFVGNGGGDFEYPVAVIDGPATAEPRQTLTLDGRDSYDPQHFEPLTYQWSLLAAPDGSAAALSEPTTLDQVYLPTDIAGVYVVSLQVTNSVGLISAPAIYTVDAVPSEELHVELSWNTGGADLDLHLIDQSAWDDFFLTPGDCNYCNQTPSWGASGSADDPSLAIDDLSGYGPENINIDSPADGTYGVAVHYYQDLGDDSVVATVRVYTYGVQVGEYSRVMERNDVWEVAEVRWPDGVSIEQSSDSYSSPYRGCRTD